MDSDPTTSETEQPHFVLFPFMAQGHTIPMVDIAKLLASHGGGGLIMVTIITTPLNAARFKPSLAGHGSIDLVELRFPCTEAGLPEGCENIDMLPSFDYLPRLYKAAAMMEPQVESLFENMKVKLPTCIVSDAWLPYTSNLASKFRVPRVSFHGTGCFSLLCIHCVRVHMEEVDRRASSGNGGFVVPGLPGGIEFTRVQLPLRLRMAGQAKPKNEFADQMVRAESEAYGVIVNSFEELEFEYCFEYKKSKQGKVWCVGPVSLTNRHELEKLQRGNNNNISLSHRSLDWLNAREVKSVMYASLGSICNLSTEQLIELALGLEASKVPFIWAIRETGATKGLYRWIVDEGFEERVAGRGMVIRGWAPQVSILSQRSIGGFLTHCGWNSCLEGISLGIPLVTWPLFGDQFSNEKLIVDVAKTGVRVGAERPTFWDGKEETYVNVKRGDVERAVRSTMEGGEEEGNRRRKRAAELGEMARKAVESGGSSYRNLAMFVEDIVHKQLH